MKRIAYAVVLVLMVANLAVTQTVTIVGPKIKATSTAESAITSLGGVTVLKDTPATEGSFALSIVSAASDTELAAGASAGNDYGWIQSFQDATSWTTRPLRLQPNGGDTITGGAFFATRGVEPVTATKTPGVTESWEAYTNEGDADGATVTLPAAAAGLTLTVYVQAAQTLTVTAGSGDTIRIAASVTAAAGSITCNVVGSSVTLLAINATEWVGIASVGTWTF